MQKIKTTSSYIVALLNLTNFALCRMKCIATTPSILFTNTEKLNFLLYWTKANSLCLNNILPSNQRILSCKNKTISTTI